MALYFNIILTIMCTEEDLIPMAWCRNECGVMYLNLSVVCVAFARGPVHVYVNHCDKK